jgi:hypothetical protein
MSRFRPAEVQPVTSGRRPLLAGSRLSPLVPTNEVMAKLSDPPNSLRFHSNAINLLFTTRALVGAWDCRTKAHTAITLCAAI